MNLSSRALDEKGKQHTLKCCIAHTLMEGLQSELYHTVGGFAGLPPEIRYQN